MYLKLSNALWTTMNIISHRFYTIRVHTHTHTSKTQYRALPIEKFTY